MALERSQQQRIPNKAYDIIDNNADKNIMVGLDLLSKILNLIIIKLTLAIKADLDFI
ncbi:hypothetical protein [Flavobacterium hiemivividum]|uniref:hypothetical protein n=1 Tax=Flavobacterium hiemivividum TaxID=2541734 RepID=UPI00140483A4|nr:hypothetical protein [Flavobacterium hiemivividum]